MQAQRQRWSNLFAVLCIALGTAAVSAVLALVNATLFAPLPFPEPDRLVRIWLADAQGDPRVDLSMPEMADLKRNLRSVEVFAGAARSRMVARLPAGAERLRGEAVDADYFPLIARQPVLGRGFLTEDFAAGSTPSVLLSDALWRRAFAADPGVIGSQLASGDSSFRIIGVLPPGFDGSIENDVIDYWIPQAHYQPAALRQERASRLGWTLARIAPGASLATLQDELDAQHAVWLQTFPGQYAGGRLRAEAFGENWRAPLRQNAGLLLAAVFMLLLIAVCNVAALLLARALDRKRELALRCALGATRGRIARALLFETGRLAVIGGTLGALAAPYLLDGLLALSPLTLPHYLELRFDLTATLLIVATLSAAALLAALLPAWLGSRVAPQSVIAAEGRGSTGLVDRRLWAGLMAGEIALSFTLLVGGAMLLRSYFELANIELGYRSESLLRMAVTLDMADYGSQQALPSTLNRLREQLLAQPGVREVGLVSPTLPPWDAERPALRHPALALADDEPGLHVGAHVVDPGLLSTLDIPLHAGRPIGTADVADAPLVAVISAALAQRLGGNDRALGSEIELDGRSGGRFRVVGVVGDVAWDGVAEQGTGRYIRFGGDDARGARHDVYLALAQRPYAVVSIAVHSAVPPEQLIEPLRRSIAQMAPSSAVHWVSSMQDELAGEYAASRFYLTLMAAFGITALLLAAVGLFALLSHALLKRQQEIGIRIALGADAARVAGLVWSDSLRMLALGLLGGVLLSALASRLLGTSLYGIGAFDPIAYLAAAVLLAMVAAAASAWPLRRALALSPNTVLRAE